MNNVDSETPSGVNEPAIDSEAEPKPVNTFNLENPNRLQFVTADYVITEGTSAKGFRVIRVGSTDGAVSVQYAINGGSATAEEDYIGGSGKLSWNVGSNLPKFIDLKIVDDAKGEVDETISLHLFNPTGDIVLGEPNQAILTIKDNDEFVPKSLQFATDSYTVSEGEAEPVTLSVIRNGDSEGPISVQYFAVSDGTAIANLDYTGDIFGTLRWEDGDSEPKPITLNLLDDKEVENPETVHVKLFNASGIDLVDSAETTLTIVDNDHIAPTVPLSLGQGMGVSEDGSLYDAISLQNLFDTRVFFWGAAKVKGQDYTATLFSQPSQMVKIVGEINVDPKHIGKVADILVVASVDDDVAAVAPLFLILDDREQVQVWDGDISTLVGIEEDIVLPQTQIIEIFHGFLAPTRLLVYFGYRLQENGFIYFNGEQPIKIAVEEKHEYSFDEQNSILFTDLNNDGQLLITASKDGIARLWDINTGSRLALLRGHTDSVKTAMFSPDDNTILTASKDGTARLWDVATKQEVVLLTGHDGSIEHATFSSNGQQIITASDDNTARIWNVVDGETLLVLKGHEQGVEYASFSNDGKQVVTTSWDNTARLWEVETGKETVVLVGHENVVEHAAFSPDDQHIVTASWDNTARVWNVETGEEVLVLTGHRNGVAYAAFSPDDEYIVTTSWDNSVRLWNAKNGEAVWMRKHQAGIHHAAFSPDGQIIVTGSNDSTARLWETATGKPIKTLQGHEGNVWQVEFSPDGKLVISASWDNSVRVWEVESGEVVMVLRD